jgi:hypothetical protein
MCKDVLKLDDLEVISATIENTGTATCGAF